MSEYTVPDVHAKVFAILSEMSVEKGGTLPANLGGKPYITAVDLSAEVKRQLVGKGLILVPQEKVITRENIIVKDRVTVSIVIEGYYQIISTVDGSSLQISGVGDGLAVGTAVASNIASTNALKNALLRFLLVTEQSVEDASKEGIPADSADSSAPTEKPVDLTSIKIAISKYIKTADNPDGVYDAEQVNAIGDKVAKSTPGNRKWTLANYKAILKVLESGEV